MFSTASTIGIAFALAVSVLVTIEYPILIRLRGNLGAQLFFTLLVTVDCLITISFLRAFFGDYPYRNELLTFFYYAFGATVGFIGWRIWKNQVAGARKAKGGHR